VYGENIAWGYNSFGDAVEAWYSEVRALEEGCMHPRCAWVTYKH
jgi:hypothetical protein